MTPDLGPNCLQRLSADDKSRRWQVKNSAYQPSLSNKKGILFLNYQNTSISWLCYMRPWKGGPSIPYPFNYFEKYPISLKQIWQISPKFRKPCTLISLKLIQVSRISSNIYKNIMYPFKILANIPLSLKNPSRASYIRLSRFGNNAD